MENTSPFDYGGNAPNPHAEKASDIIHEARRKLTEALLPRDPVLILKAADAHLLLTRGEVSSLGHINDSQEFIENLIDMVLSKDESTHKRFLEFLQNLRRIFPDLQPISEFLEDGAAKPISSSVTEGLASPPRMRNTHKSIPAGNTYSGEAKEEGDVSGIVTKRSLDSRMISGHEMIRKGRKELLEILQKDVDLLLDELNSQSVITEEEYEDLDQTEEDSKKKKHLLPEKEFESPSVPQEAKKEASKDCSSEEQEEEMQQVPEQEGKLTVKEKKESLMDILTKLKLWKYKSKNLAMKNVLELTSESLQECTSHALGDLPWHFLRKVLAINVTARNTSLEQETYVDEGMRGKEEEIRIDENIFFSEIDGRDSVNPHDVLCAVLLCSDSFLQQEILLKMSMCQFALPFLLPPLETSKCTLMLWAMRDIVKKWRPHSLAQIKGFREESLVLTSMPTVSFVRMGTSSFSKSKLLNELLSPSQQHHDFFIHRDMEGGNVPREIADGLVEIACYFPGQKNSDLFPEPITVANLRGDVESHWVQFSFLTEISSAVFIFAESIGVREYALLSSLKESSTQYYFILESHNRKPNETLNFLNKLAPVLHLNNSRIFRKARLINNAEFVGNLRSTVEKIISAPPKSMSIREMATVARELIIQVDEDCQECQKALRCAVEITEDIKDVPVYKKEMLKLQGDLWKNLAKVEKELCRMERQGDKPSEQYRSELKGKLLELRRQQNECELTIGLSNFVSGIRHLTVIEKHYFLKWMKFELDQMARTNLSKLRAEYKDISGDNSQKMVEVDQLMSSSSLGVEHFMRELGQFYEAEYSMVKEGRITNNKRQFVHFPSIAADLLLEGFPLELIDGDASNIPLQWITDVMTELHNMLGGQSKMLVITVLGVQSTGKSTLLNTMFGLQFAVSSGRCTRGAFMTLLKVTKDLKKELGCDFILVIDTEGLKAPELAKLEDSYQHDNELATLVIGLSDITIVNMAMENATEMKDILQIVTHAFLRMESTGQKPNCQFVHQNVSDVSAHDQNMRDRKHLLEQLNEMTQAAAKMENVDRNIKFSDLMDYDPEMHNWYIPGLWHGVPPMAPVNRGYSEKVFELKKFLFEFIRNRSLERSLKDIPQFIEWVKSLWNAVKHENFIFSFRNSLVAETYNRLSMKFYEWDWAFRREIHLWVSEQETLIQNASPDEFDQSLWQCELQKKLSAGEEQILEQLKQYFESRADNLHLIERYREDFVRSSNSLKQELERYCSNKCRDAIRIKQGRHKIDALQAGYLEIIEGKVDKLLEECRKKQQRLEDQELEREFERMWTETLTEISPIHLVKRKIPSDVELCLRKALKCKGKLVNAKLMENKALLSYRINTFQIKKEYINSSWWKFWQHNSSKMKEFAEEFAKPLMGMCHSYICERVNSKENYDETFCGDLLNMIDEKLKQGDVQNRLTASFEVDLKLHVFGEAASAFQKMHEDYIMENDPQRCLMNLKCKYLSAFKDLYLSKDAQQVRAKDFCFQCLQPALEDYVNKRLGIEVVDDILNSRHSIRYSSRTFFQFTILKELLEESKVEKYVEYLISYEEFVKSWIQKQILDHSEKIKNLEQTILSAIIAKIRETLKIMKHKPGETISEFLDNFCQEMQKELVISTNSFVGKYFKNKSPSNQFSVFVNSFLPDLEREILSEFDKLDVESKLSKLPVKPVDEIFKRVFGCGKQCPFCKIPCEAGGNRHEQHFAAVHRPQGLGKWREIESQKLICSLCSTDVASNREFGCPETEWHFRPYKEYRNYFPDWRIQPDPSVNASDYWKFVTKEFNDEFAKNYKAEPADLPEDWKNITKEQALETLKATYNMMEHPCLEGLPLRTGQKMWWRWWRQRQ